MFKKIIEKITGNYSEREIKRLWPVVEKVLSYGDEYKKLTDEELRGKTAEFKARLAEGETLDDILPEAFATVIEASDRVLQMRHFPVQILGGIVLHQGRIAEMKTGEGKTLVSTLPAYLNALSGKGVHIVTVNDYLAKRDSEWMGKIYRFLGLSVGLVIHEVTNDERRNAYLADITYGTNNEFGFDYLRDNMVIYKEQMVQRGQNFAIVDEVDSILIDEARTPLIISGQGDKSTDLYLVADRFAKSLKKKVFVEVDSKSSDENIDADYIVDEKAKTATLTPAGVAKAESYFNVENLSDSDNMTLSHHINQAIRANGIMKRDIDYVEKDGEIIIVDEHTGRLMFGRRYSDGLHQAIEAKEGVTVERESKTLATITFQNYFRLYAKLSGMTGTALTEETEFQEIYKLDVIVIPTNKPLARQDLSDLVYKNEKGKLECIVKEIIEVNKKGQPVLVGTASIEKSELISRILKKNGIKHEVLNAKYHEKEAEIIAQTGKKGAVTIATNMAGRGTDIVLGGNPEFMALKDLRKQDYPPELIAEANSFAETDDPDIIAIREKYNALHEKYKEQTAKEREEVIALGGLYIIGTERHESRRIDNQLRGRAGRQGDPGTSRFYISLEDDLMRLFGSDRLKNVVSALGLQDDEPIEHSMLTSQIEKAQMRVEGRNFEIRKHVIQFDDVMNEQRKVIYGERQRVLNGEDLKETMLKMLREVVENRVALCTAAGEYEHEWDLKSLAEWAAQTFKTEGITITDEERETLTPADLTEKYMEMALSAYEKKEQEFGENMRELERVILLQVVDMKWMDHIDAMDQLKGGIGLRAYGQRDPVVEFKFEGYDMFEEMIAAMKEDTIKYIMGATINNEVKRQQVANPSTASHGSDEARKPVRKGEKIGRNDLCPCGSGKKYKKCCGR